MSTIIIVVLYILFLIVSFVFFAYINKVFSLLILLYNKKIIVENSEKIIYSFEKCKEIIYNKKYYEYLSIELINETHIDSKTLDKVIKEYVKEVFLIMGDNLIENMIVMKGSKESIIAELSFEFKNRILKEDINKFESIKNIKEIEK